MFVHCYYRGPARSLCSYRAHHNPVRFKDADGLSMLPVTPSRSFAPEEQAAKFAKWAAYSPTRPIKLPFLPGLESLLPEGIGFVGKSPSATLKSKFGELVYSALRDALEELYPEIVSLAAPMITPAPPIIDYDV